MRLGAAPSLLLALSACLGAAPAPAGDADATVATATLPDASAARASGAEAHRLLVEFAMGHPFRNNENMEAKRGAQAYLEARLAEIGLRTESHAYRGTGTNILAFHPGALRGDEWIVLSCHADVIRSTVYGARDDGLGCAALLEMARAFSQTAWNRTLVFAFFDEEELGLVGARAFVKEFGLANDTRVAANLNFDPAGLHHPCGDAAGTYPVYLMITESKVSGAGAIPGYAEVLDAVREGYVGAGVPDDKIRVSTTHAYARVNGQAYLPPGSDDDAFDEADIPSIWVGAPPADEIGPLMVWGYPNHQPTDTAELVEARCGSAQLLRAGLQAAMDASLAALITLDAQVW